MSNTEELAEDRRFSSEELLVLQTDYDCGRNTGEKGVRLLLLQNALGLEPNGIYGPETRAAHDAAFSFYTNLQGLGEEVRIPSPNEDLFQQMFQQMFQQIKQVTL